MRFTVPFISRLAALPLLLAAQGASAQARVFKVESGGSNIQFVSDATFEKITGVSSKATGDITVDPNLVTQGTAKVTVGVASIRTGIELRDEHLRSPNWLDAKRCPNAEFVVTQISGVDKLKANEAVEVNVKGKFTIHCVTKNIATKARVRFTPASAETQANKMSGDMLRIQASFVVKLEDHEVSIPSVVSLKVSPNIQVNVDLRATAH